MRLRPSLFVVTFLCIFASRCHNSDAQNQNLYQLSYGGEAMAPYRPPTTSTTPAPTTTEKSGGWFSGIKKFFKKKEETTPTPEVQVTTSKPQLPTATSSQTSSSVPPKMPTVSSSSSPQSTPTLPSKSTPIPQGIIPNSPIHPPVQPTASTTASLPTSVRDYVNPNIPISTRPPTPKPSQPLPSIPPSSTTTTGRGDYVNPNIPISTRPSIPSSHPTIPSTSTTSGHRDYVNPNLSTRKPPAQKEDFPALPPPRNPNIPASPTSTGTTPSSVWSTKPIPNSNPTGVSFVPRPTSRPSSRFTTPKSNKPELATDAEITSLTETLYTKDVNNLFKYITVNYQGKTKSYEYDDVAPQPLLQVDRKAFDVTTVSKMRALFDNYELDTSINEYVTPHEKNEENEFIDAVMATSVMRQAMTFLQGKGLVTPDPKTHRDLLKSLWFGLFSRGGGKIGSSSFEHIFLSEVKNGTVTGLHNWVYFHQEEQNRNLDYKGYLKTLDLGNKGAIAKFRFTHNGLSKPVNGLFIGTSPEFEMALYTVCFQLRADKECPVSLNGSTFILRTYTFRYRGKNFIGSAYPEF